MCVYIWGGIFVISGYRVFIQAGFRVGSWIFLIKPGPASGFFFLKKKPIPNPIPNQIG